MDPRFEKLLIKYAGTVDKARQEKIRQELWKEFGTTGAVLIMDMSGFSLLTQKYGIIHYLSMVKRMQLNSRPVIQDAGGKVIKYEADNCFALFDDVLPAVRAAMRLNATFNEISRFTDEQFDIRLSTGIDYGEVLLTGDSDYFGDTVNIACKLGEDVAGPGEILLTERAFTRLPAQAGYTGKPVTPVLSGIQISALKLKYTI